jgi:hypothetical protein
MQAVQAFMKAVSVMANRIQDPVEGPSSTYCIPNCSRQFCPGLGNLNPTEIHPLKLLKLAATMDPTPPNDCPHTPRYGRALGLSV